MQDSDAFLGEIRMFPFGFAPTGWAVCAGQLLPLSQNTALFSVIGTIYGGNGTSNFALPDLQGIAPMHAGQGTGLSERSIGEYLGEPSVTLTTKQLPAHDHAAIAYEDLATTADPTDSYYMQGNYDDGMGHAGGVQLYITSAPDTKLAAAALLSVGSSSPHNNMMPSLAVNFCIAVQGIFPSHG
jgi:microcystin-dependent protein